MRLSASSLIVAFIAGWSVATAVFAVYPEKPVRVIVPFAPGGTNDVAARIVAEKFSERFAQAFVVDNRAGANGVVGAEITARAAADGYTLLIDGSPLWLLPLFRKAGWDALKDFAPLTLAVSSPSMLVVHPSVPVKSLRELIALAKARPGELNYAAGTIGATPHLAGEQFKVLAGVKIGRAHV